MLNYVFPHPSTQFLQTPLHQPLCPPSAILPKAPTPLANLQIFDPFQKQPNPPSLPKQKENGEIPLLELNNIEFRRQGSTEKLFDFLHLTVRGGDCVLLIGDNGCGKSTRKFYFVNCSTKKGKGRGKNRELILSVS